MTLPSLPHLGKSKPDNGLAPRSDFVNKLDSNRRSVVVLLSTIFFGISILGMFFQLRFVVQSPTGNLFVYIYVGVDLLLILIFAYLRLNLVKKNYTITFRVIYVLIFAVVCLLLLRGGTINWMAYLMMLIGIISTSIVLGSRAAVRLTFFYSIALVVILYLHLSGTVRYYPGDLHSSTPSTLISIVLMFLAAYLTKIGFGQIEESYSQAYNYAKQLEGFNEKLDKEVHLRTQQLKESFEQQTRSLYSNATIGRITSSMLHDIATPLSTLRGGYNLLKGTTDEEEKHSILEISEKAVFQIGRIVSNAQSLINDETPNELFSPKTLIETSLIITKHQLRDEGIEVNVKIDSNVEIFGVAGIFERIFLNLLTNAVDELKAADQEEKHIGIRGYKIDDEFVLEIRDNGRGIATENLEKIFEPEFTLKKGHSNLGMGLHFVKITMSKFFNGNVSVETQVGKGTKFILNFDIGGSGGYETVSGKRY